MNPSTLGGLYDAEFRNAPEVDVLTVAEVIQEVTDEVWSELTGLPSDSTNRNPAISSLRRNLQSEHLARLIELSLEEDAGTPASRTISKFGSNATHRYPCEDSNCKCERCVYTCTLSRCFDENRKSVECPVHRRWR